MNLYSFISLFGEFLWINFNTSYVLWCDYENLFTKNILIIILKWICGNEFDFTWVSLRHYAEFNVLIQSYSSLWEILILTQIIQWIFIFENMILTGENIIVDHLKGQSLFFIPKENLFQLINDFLSILESFLLSIKLNLDGTGFSIIFCILIVRLS